MVNIKDPSVIRKKIGACCLANAVNGEYFPIFDNGQLV